MTRPIFSEKTKEKIFERDGWQCTMCGMGRREGEDVAVWFLKPWECGGKATVENGTTLCPKHFFLVQQYGAIGAAKMTFEEIRGKLAEK